MRKSFYIIMTVAVLFLCFACETNPAISVSFIDITGAGSTENTFVASFSEEKEYKDKSCDILVKGQIDGLTLKVAKENQEFITIVLPNKDVWYSLTALVFAGQGQTGNETYLKYSDVSSLTYIIRSNIDSTILLKAVVGTIEENADGGELLANRQDCSKEFSFELKKYVEN